MTELKIERQQATAIFNHETDAKKKNILRKELDKIQKRLDILEHGTSTEQTTAAQKVENICIQLRSTGGVISPTPNPTPAMSGHGHDFYFTVMETNDLKGVLGDTFDKPTQGMRSRFN